LEFSFIFKINLRKWLRMGISRSAFRHWRRRVGAGDQFRQVHIPINSERAAEGQIGVDFAQRTHWSWGQNGGGEGALGGATFKRRAWQYQIGPWNRWKGGSAGFIAWECYNNTVVFLFEKQPSSDLERNSRIGKMHIKNASSSTASARLWDGRIEIDDLSSTDDGTFEFSYFEKPYNQNSTVFSRSRNRCLAWATTQVEENGIGAGEGAEGKGVATDRWFVIHLILSTISPPSALTRPLFYQPEVVSQQSVPEQRQPLSPNETNLLPAIFQPQLAAVQPQFVVTQQQPQLSITRPHATVAPSLSTTSVPTTPATSSISM
jgi:hypothetical protein